MQSMFTSLAGSRFGSRGTSWDPLKTADRWAHEAHAVEELLRVLRPANIVRLRSPTVNRVAMVPAVFV